MLNDLAVRYKVSAGEAKEMVRRGAEIRQLRHQCERRASAVRFSRSGVPLIGLAA